MRWLPDCSIETLAEALRAVAPQLGHDSIVLPEHTAKEDPRWWASSAVIDGEFIAKFAWSRTAALRIAHEIGVLTALAPDVPFLPEVVAASTDPLLLITRKVPGASLFEVVDSIDRDRAGSQLARFLAALHSAPARLAPARQGPQHPASTEVLRARLEKWLEPDQQRAVVRWCDWADIVLATPRPDVPVHADLHGNNQVWRGDELQLVVDFETAGAAEPEYDLRTFPGPGMGPGVELFTATLRHYQRITGRELAVDRVMAWHLRTALGDVLWRSEAGIPLADHRTPGAWVDDLSARFDALGITHG